MGFFSRFKSKARAVGGGVGHGTEIISLQQAREDWPQLRPPCRPSQQPAPSRLILKLQRLGTSGAAGPPFAPGEVPNGWHLKLPAIFALLQKKDDDVAALPAGPAAAATLSASDRAAAYRPASASLLSASYNHANAALLAGCGGASGDAAGTTRDAEPANGIAELVAERGPEGKWPPRLVLGVEAIGEEAAHAAVAATAAELLATPLAVRPLAPDPAMPIAAAAATSSASFVEAGMATVESSSGSCSTPADVDAASDHSSWAAGGGGSASLSVAALGRLQRPSPSVSVASEGSVAASRVDWVAAARAGQGTMELSAQRQIRLELGPEMEARLRQVFGEYASLGSGKGPRVEELDSARFYKLCCECGLLDRRFSRGYVDVVFTMAKKKKEMRRLTFGDFCTALRLTAFRKRWTLQQVVDLVDGCAGPQLNDVTTPESVRLYDDLSTWTGVQFRVAAEAACAAPGGGSLTPAASLGSISSLGASGAATLNAARSGSLAELVARQQQMQHAFLDPEKASAEAAAAEKRRREAEATIRAAESEAHAAVSRAAAADKAATAKAHQAAVAVVAAIAAIHGNAAAAEKAKCEVAALHEAAAVQQEAARAAERDAAVALRRAADAEKAGQAEAEAALVMAGEKERRAKDAATSAWAAAANASAAAEAVAVAATEAASTEGWSEESASEVVAAQEEAEAAAMAAILAAKQEAEAAMIDALMQAEAAEAVVNVARAEAAAAGEALEAAKAEAAALMEAAAAAEAAAATEEAAKEAAQQRAVAAKEAAAAAAVARRKVVARAKQDAEKAFAVAVERRESAAAAAQQAADAAVRASAAVNSRFRAQQKLAEALYHARAAGLVTAASATLVQPATPEQRPPPAAAMQSPEAAAVASMAAVVAARERFAGVDGIMTAKLKKVWLEFAVFGKNAQQPEAPPRMEGVLFSKLCKECCLVDGDGLTVAQVDLIFGKVAEKGFRSINFKQFLAALPLLAAARGCEEHEVRMLVAATEGPVRRGTTPLAVRFHDRWHKA